MKVHVRAARPEDADLVRSWRGDPRIRGFEEDAERPGEIIEVDGEPIGWLDPHPAYAPAWQHVIGPSVGREPWTLDILVAPEHWGRGIAQAAIRAVSERCLSADASSMVVDVEPDNVASQRAFLGAGWVTVDTDEDETIMRYPPDGDRDPV